MQPRTAFWRWPKMRQPQRVAPKPRGGCFHSKLASSFTGQSITISWVKAYAYDPTLRRRKWTAHEHAQRNVSATLHEGRSRKSLSKTIRGRPGKHNILKFLMR